VRLAPSVPLEKPLSTSPGKGKGKGKAQDAPHKEPSAPTTLQTQSKHPESWYDKLTHRPSAKGWEKESKETQDSWLRARDVSSIYFVLYECPIVFPFFLMETSKDTQISSFFLLFKIKIGRTMC
jgi:hypothetical protein